MELYIFLCGYCHRAWSGHKHMFNSSTSETVTRDLLRAKADHCCEGAILALSGARRLVLSRVNVAPKPEVLDGADDESSMFCLCSKRACSPILRCVYNSTIWRTAVQQ